MKKSFVVALVFAVLAVAAVGVFAVDNQTQDQLALRAQGMDY